MSAVVAETPTKRSYGDLKSKRTEAMPKNSLFGSNIERLDDTERKQLAELDMAQYEKDVNQQRKQQQDRYKVKAPDYLRNKISDESLKYSKDELAKQAEQTKRAVKLMGILQEKSKYYSVGSMGNRGPKSTPGRESFWMNSDDLNHVGDINIVGTGGTKSYNHAKYKPKAAMHNYSLTGDPLELGMDMPTSQSAPQRQAHVFRLERKGPPDRRPMEYYMKKSAADSEEVGGMKLPPNIAHQFGTRICHNVLSDKLKVEETLQYQRKREKAFWKSTHGKYLQPVVNLEDTIDPAYESLGATLRLDFFPGHSYNHKESVATSVYTKDVFTQRVPDPDKHRYQRDYLSTWAEQNVLRERVKKAWDTYLQETLSKN